MPSHPIDLLRIAELSHLLTEVVTELHGLRPQLKAHPLTRAVVELGKATGKLQSAADHEFHKCHDVDSRLAPCFSRDDLETVLNRQAERLSDRLPNDRDVIRLDDHRRRSKPPRRPEPPKGAA